MADQNAGDSSSPTSNVVVTRVVPEPVDTLWGRLATPDGARALLGEGGAFGDKGDSWRADDGTHGVVRSYHPSEQIRFSWHPDADGPGSLVEVHLRPEVEGSTLVEIRHQNLPGTPDEEALARRWESALDRLVQGSGDSLG